MENETGSEIDIDRYKRRRNPSYVRAGEAAGINYTGKSPTRKRGTTSAGPRMSVTVTYPALHRLTPPFIVYPIPTQ
ncbi:hypothetical protein EVAR_65144_1 [Eumeta japonica]|uniref:Uncharacterized protein n=1 Tax=Eumeta variegata TaxID=151549 RepID=A0A4C1ZZA9_EUMVA|nr:hypothetical protein EVAR_65144_1 [Eumeta japonica]